MLSIVIFIIFIGTLCLVFITSLIRDYKNYPSEVLKYEDVLNKYDKFLSLELKYIKIKYEIDTDIHSININNNLSLKLFSIKSKQRKALKNRKKYLKLVLKYLKEYDKGEYSHLDYKISNKKELEKALIDTKKEIKYILERLTSRMGF